MSTKVGITAAGSPIVESSFDRKGTVLKLRESSINDFAAALSDCTGT